MIGSQKNLFLQFCIFNLVVVNQYIFSQRFHCIDLAIRDLFDKKNFSKTTFSEDLDNPEVSKAYFFLRFGVDGHCSLQGCPVWMSGSSWSKRLSLRLTSRTSNGSIS